MNCPRCGASLRDAATECSSCGMPSVFMGGDERLATRDEVLQPEVLDSLDDLDGAGPAAGPRVQVRPLGCTLGPGCGCIALPLLGARRRRGASAADRAALGPDPRPAAGVPGRPGVAGAPGLPVLIPGFDARDRLPCPARPRRGPRPRPSARRSAPAGSSSSDRHPVRPRGRPGAPRRPWTGSSGSRGATRASRSRCCSRTRRWSDATPP